MEIILWVLTGAAVGWLSYLFLRFNEARGMHVSIAIGAAGALLGGKVLAPMFTTAAAADFSVPALFFAATAAAILLVLGNLVYVRWGV
jgi:uncharacterized membrane protein YeaQ/YmgE (transglycosylase-associated protein family)